uniref:Uncharacterized protein n=1 Tax=Panagrolaimus davidi TaxID=227884 RepID=A0A914PL48_9BILA
MEILAKGITFTRKDGRVVKIKAKITDVASQMLYQHCSHGAYGFACTTCTVFPVHEQGARRWALKSGELRAESNNRTGLASVDTAFCKLAPENLIRLDGLHVLDEGLLLELQLIVQCYGTVQVLYH